MSLCHLIGCIYTNINNHNIQHELDPVGQSVASLDCRFRGRELDPGLIPYFHGD